MKHLLTLIALSTVALIGYSTVVSSRPSDKIGYSDFDGLSDCDSDESSLDEDESSAAENDSSVTSSDEDSYYKYGREIFRDGNKVVYMDYLYGVYDEFVETYCVNILQTVVDDQPIDTCVVGRFTNYGTEGDMLWLSVGIDTVRVSLRDIPKRIDPETVIMLDGMKASQYHHRFALNEEARACEYDIVAYLPENPPVWTKQVLASLIEKGMAGFFSGGLGINDTYGFVNGNAEKSLPRFIVGADASEVTPDEIAKHYAGVYEENYRKEFGPSEGETIDEDLITAALKVDYMFRMIPVWESEDGKYITYRFFDYTYGGGMHGYFEEFYLTFNTHTGLLLGWKDMMSAADLSDCISVLEREMKNYRIREGISYGGYSPFLNDAGDGLLKELYNGQYLPRPAVTDKGVVFSYQPYEAGCFAEGVLHFLIPTSELPEGFKIPLSSGGDVKNETAEESGSILDSRDLKTEPQEIVTIQSAQPYETEKSNQGKSEIDFRHLFVAVLPRRNEWKRE